MCGGGEIDSEMRFVRFARMVPCEEVMIADCYGNEGRVGWLEERLH